MVFEFENGCDFTLAMVLGPVGMVFYIFFPDFLKIWRESKTKGAVLAFRIGLKKFVWFGFWVILIVGVFWTFKGGINRNFVGVTVSNQLVLDYPWPKADAIINWPEVVTVSSESKKFGVWGSTWFRLKVVTHHDTYVGLWLPKEQEAIEVGEAISSALAKQNLHE